MTESISTGSRLGARRTVTHPLGRTTLIGDCARHCSTVTWVTAGRADQGAPQFLDRVRPTAEPTRAELRERTDAPEDGGDLTRTGAGHDPMAVGRPQSPRSRSW